MNDGQREGTSIDSSDVRRERLLQVLRDSAADIVIVSAPAGYGKTTLLRQWLALDGRPTAWVELGDARDSAARLRRAVSDAIATLNPPYVVVIDGLHHGTGNASLAALSTYAKELPAGCTLVCAGRSVPGIPLGTVRAQKHVVDVGVEAMAFDVDEAALLLRAHGLVVPPGDLAGLVERTEGWPAALHLAANGARQASDPLRSLAEFAGDERTVVEMFANDVLRDLSPESLDFLVAVAPLTRFSGAQCDAVLDRTGSAQLLEAIAIETMLVIPIDHRREWYRLHGALRDYLEAERRVRGGPSPEVVLGRASVWCEERGDIDAAIELAGAAHDVGRATDLVLGHFSTRVGSGQPLTVQRWLRDIDDTTVVTNPSLQAVAGLVRMWLGDPDGVLRCLHRAEFVLPERHPASGPLAEPAACVAALRALLGSISAQEMRDEARYARQHATSPVWFAIACLADGGSSLMLGELDTAEESLRRAAALGEACNATTWAFSLAALALLHDRAGERERAIAGARAARQVVVDHGLGGAPQMFLVFLANAYFEMSAGRFDSGATERDKGVELMSHCVGIGLWAHLQGHVVLAHLAHLSGDAHGKSKWLDAAERMLQRMPDAVHLKSQIAEARKLVTVSHDGSNGLQTLSAAERRVLHYLPTHLGLAEIADRLYLSRHTVKSHVVSVYRKLGVANRSEAVEVAYKAGLLDSGLADTR